MPVVTIEPGKNQSVTLSSATTSDTYQLDGRSGTVQITTAGTVSLTAAVKLSNDGTNFENTSTAYSAAATTMYSIPAGVEYAQFEVTAFTSGSITYVLNLSRQAN